jgi:FkbM family methyltransferase
MVEMKNTHINGEWELILPIHRHLRPEWTSSGGWEKARLKSMNGRIDKGDIVYYIGAEEFDLCALVSLWGGELVAFEPNEKVMPNGKVIYEANNLKMPLACFAGFASDTTAITEQLFYNGFPPCADGDVIGDHGFRELRNGGNQVKIDDFVSMTGLVPKHITMDIEGAEGRALRGAEQTLLKHRPNLWISIHPEFLIDQYKEYSYDLRNWIKDRGYKEIILDYQHELHTLYTPL